MTYRVMFFRRLTGERGTLEDAFKNVASTGLSKVEAVALKEEGEACDYVATDFWIESEG